VNAILDGDPDAFGRLCALDAPRIHAFAISRMRDTAEAEDIVQDTSLEVHRCLGAWEGRSRLLTSMLEEEVSDGQREIFDQPARRRSSG
jgi:DNA-directed RNA polymerase specialized sigma24 family protein